MTIFCKVKNTCFELLNPQLDEPFEDKRTEFAVPLYAHVSEYQQKVCSAQTTIYDAPGRIINRQLLFNN